MLDLVLGRIKDPLCSPCTLQDRAIARSAEWRTAIQAVDAETLGHLRERVAGGFDEERFGACIGFSKLKRRGPALIMSPASLPSSCPRTPLARSGNLYSLCHAAARHHPLAGALACTSQIPLPGSCIQQGDARSCCALEARGGVHTEV